MADPCTQCGQVHPRGCKGHRSSDPTQPCKNSPIKGGTVCGTHGGRSPQVRASANANIERAKTERLVQSLGLVTEEAAGVDPAQLLLEEITRSAMVVRFLDEKAADQLENGDADHPIVGAWERARTHYRRVVADALKIGIAERQVAAAEASGGLIVIIVERVARALGHNPDDEQTSRILELAMVLEEAPGLGA